jgi:hypothetical protein
MKRGGELKRITPLCAGTTVLRRTELARKTALNPGTKRLRQSRSTGKATVAESARIVLVKKLGCICCMLNRTWGMPTAFFGPCEAHHLLSGGRRRGHEATIGLCRWHHQAVRPYEAMTTDETIERFGPSVATGSKPFHATYGANDELLEFQEALLELAQEVIQQETPP